jgi:type I restriction enzyme S subunit
MTPWTRRPVRELCSAIIDCVNKTAPTVDDPTPWRMIRTTNVKHGRVSLEAVRYVERNVYQKWIRRGEPLNGDIILTREAPLGEIGRLRNSSGVFLGQRLVLYRADPCKVDPNFLLFAMRGPGVQAQIRAFGSGATVEHMRVPDCGELLIDCPPLEVQRRIGLVLSTFNELIEISERRIELLEDFAHSLYHDWIVSIRFTGCKERHGSVRIPQGWCAKQLGEIADVNRHTVKARHLPDPLEYLDISSLGIRRRERLKILSATDAPGRARRKVSDGDVVWATVRPNRRAHCVIHDPPQNLIASTGLAVLTPVSVPSSFLFEYASSQEFSDYLVGRATGSAYPAVRPEDFRSAPVVVPPESLLERFAAAADPVLRLTNALRRQCDQQAEVRDLLLPRLVSGQLDISDIDLGTLTPAEAA